MSWTSDLRGTESPIWAYWMLALGVLSLRTCCHAERSPSHTDRMHVGALVDRQTQMSSQPTASINHQRQECTSSTSGPAQPSDDSSPSCQLITPNETQVRMCQVSAENPIPRTTGDNNKCLIVVNHLTWRYSSGNQM